MNDDNVLARFQDTENDFKSLWVKYTRKQTGVKISERDLVSFYYDLRGPLGQGIYSLNN